MKLIYFVLQIFNLKFTSSHESKTIMVMHKGREHDYGDYRQKLCDNN